MSLTLVAPFGCTVPVLGFRSSISGWARTVISGRQPHAVAGVETVRGEPLLDLDSELGVPSHVRLTRTAPRPLARNHGTTLEDLAAPDTPGLAPLHRAGEALDAQRAVPA